MRGATRKLSNVGHVHIISIHAPHAGRDLSLYIVQTHDNNFNPRAPCGARLTSRMYTLSAASFQSTRPMRGATLIPELAIRPMATISIHAPHAGRDHPPILKPYQEMYFNPRAPCGARPIAGSISNSTWKFQSTRPMRGATLRYNCLAAFVP